MTVLTPMVLLDAYAQGYFPMPDEKSGEIFWYRPDPRAILPLDGFHVSRSLRRTLQKGHLEVTFSKDFEGVMRACADRQPTWINEEFVQAYGELHRKGAADSVEVWENGQLVGGCYGVHFGSAFFAESMFHRKTDASKVALYHLVSRLNANGFLLLECQFLTEHLRSLGAIEIPDSEIDAVQHSLT